MKKIGAEPSHMQSDGTPFYGVPAIIDDSNGKVVSDSMRIAEYLDDTYPDRPLLFPFSSRAPIYLFNSHLMSACVMPMVTLFIALTPPILGDSGEFYRKKQEARWNVNFETVIKEKKVELLETGKEAWSKLAVILGKNGPDAPFFYGRVPSYADLIVVAFLLWMKVILGSDNVEWKQILEWDGGRWAKMLQDTQEFWPEVI